MSGTRPGAMSRRTSGDLHLAGGTEGEYGRRTSGHRRTASTTSSSRRRAKTTSGSLSSPKSTAALRSSLPATTSRPARAERDEANDYDDTIPEHPHDKGPRVRSDAPSMRPRGKENDKGREDDGVEQEEEEEGEDEEREGDESNQDNGGDDVDIRRPTPSMQGDPLGRRDSPTLGHRTPSVRRRHESTPEPRSDALNVESGRAGHQSLPVRTDSAVGDMPEVNLVILGAPGVGKSNFVQRALGLAGPSPTFLSSRKMLIGGVIYMVRLLELELDRLDLDERGRIRWPAAVDDIDLPRIHGALVLCDLDQPRSIEAIPAILGTMVAADLPSAFVASRCEAPAESRQIQLSICQRAGLGPDQVDCVQLATGMSDSEKRCVGAIIRKVRSRMIDPPEGVAPWRRAENRAARQSSVPLRSSIRSDRNELDSTGSSLAQARTTSRNFASGSSGANADAWPPPPPPPPPSRSTQYEGATSTTANIHQAQHRHHHHHHHRHPHKQGAQQHQQRGQHQQQQPPRRSSSSADASLNAHPIPGRPAAAGVSVSEAGATSFVVVSDPPFHAPTLPTPGTPLYEKMGSFFKEPDYGSDRLGLIDDGGHDDGVLPTTPPRPDGEHEEDYGEDDPSRQAVPTVGETLEGLVDRLLAPPVSKSDVNFPIIFLCLYRKFAAPGQVLGLILTRFQEAQAVEGPSMDRTTAQLRYLGILLQWLLSYPGDFAHPWTRRRVTDLITGVAGARPFANVAKDLRAALDVFVEDDDAIWARSDMGPTTGAGWGAPLSPAETSVDELEARMREANIGSDDGGGGSSGGSGGATTSAASGPRSARVSGAPSQSSSGENSTTLSGGSSQTLVNGVDAAEREAQMLVPMPRTRLSKVLWRQFMEMPEDDFAQELTRIDWIMYSAIRPRDIVRHITLSAEQRERTKSVENVNRMINQFNHVACWVTNMILLRDKPKHRARALEKFMKIAWRLRYLNNYNSLGAIVAGVSGNAIYRLIQTRELVTPHSQKEFMRLEILMGTQKSHFAYRLAWKNTSAPRIPFLPLHRRDLVSGDEGNRTFADNGGGGSGGGAGGGEGSGAGRRINWKKFEIMGEVIVSLHKSQAAPYQDLERKPEVQRLVLDCELVKDDDTLYERSAELESPGAGAGDTSMRRKFSWFQR